MEEMNVTQPEVAQVETTTDETTTTGEEVTEEVTTQTTEQPEDNTADEQGTEDGEGTSEEGSTTEDEFSLQVKYNKQTQNLSKDDAVRYAQMGLKYESMQPTLKKLQFLAVSDNTTLEKFVDSIVDGVEQSKLQRFERKANGDKEILEALIQEDKRKGGKAYEEWQEAERKALEKEEQDEIKTLATEFGECLKQLPQLNGKKFEDVPEAVLQLREKHNISLLDAYLRYEHGNRVASQKAIDKQRENAETSTGSVVSSDGETTSGLSKELLGALWGN